MTERPRIAVVANDAIGNFVIATPLLQLLRAELKPEWIHYYGGVRTLELQDASDLFEAHFPLHGSCLRDAEDWRLARDEPPYDLVVNLEWGPIAKAFASFLAERETQVCGPCLGVRGDLPYPDDARGDLWRDQEWLSEAVTTRYSFLKSGFIGEIFSRLCYLEGDLPRYKLPASDPGRDLPDVLIATSASLPEKLWPTEKWLALARRLEGRSIGLLGAPPTHRASWQGASTEDELVESGLVEDLRGKFTLPQVVGALAKAKAVVTLDNGILHLASASETPIVGLYRNGIHRLWAPPFANVRTLTPDEGGEVADIEVDAVLRGLES